MLALSTAKLNQLKMCRARGLRMTNVEEQLLDSILPEEDLPELFGRTYIKRALTAAKPMQQSEMREAFGTSRDGVSGPMQDGEGNLTCVFFLAAKGASLGKGQVEACIALAIQLGCRTCILVGNRGYSDEAAKAVAEASIMVDFFHEDNLQFNLPDHKMVPRHQRCSEEEKRILYAETGANALRLPILRSADPVAIYYGWRTGTLVRIIRDFGFLDMPAQYNVSYRVVL